MRNEYCTIGNVPVNAIPTSIMQCENQGWKVRFVEFCGIMNIKPPLFQASASPQTMPMYVIIACKEFAEGEEVVVPVFNMKEGA